MTSEWSPGKPQSGAGDQIIYYRRPKKGENAGWIIWGDSISGSKFRDYARRGFQALLQYGTINTVERDNRAFGTKISPPAPEFRDLTMNMFHARYLWEAILTHPDGPAEFPVEQIVTARWYRPENVPVADVIFPQLKGLKIKEYNCPERCGRPAFVDIDGVGGVTSLANHLKISHEWDRVNISAYGDRVGIDFNKLDVVLAPVTEYEVSAEVPSYVCKECDKSFKARVALAGHMRSHPLVEIEVAG